MMTKTPTRLFLRYHMAPVKGGDNRLFSKPGPGIRTGFRTLITGLPDYG
jgi:hypothetical protein